MRWLELSVTDSGDVIPFVWSVVEPKRKLQDWAEKELYGSDTLLVSAARAKTLQSRLHVYIAIEKE